MRFFSRQPAMSVMEVEGFSYPSEHLTRVQPKNLKLEDVSLFSVEFNKYFNAVYPEIIKNVLLFPNGFCFVNGVYFSAQNLKHKVKVYIKSLFPIFQIRKIRSAEYAVLLTDINSYNFFHWFCDVLQKIEAMKAYGVDLKGVNFIIPKNINIDLVTVASSIYNISFNFLQADEIRLVKKLIVIPQISPTGNYRPLLIRNIRDRFIGKYGYKSDFSRIYITRSKALKRKILNEEKITGILEKYKFTIVAMEDLDFDAQIRLVMGAEVLVGLHGAGLTHMLWMNSGSKIMEIRLKGDEVNNCYFSLASDLQLNYYYYLAEKVNANVPTQFSDFRVSPLEFEKSLSIMLAS